LQADKLTFEIYIRAENPCKANIHLLNMATETKPDKQGFTLQHKNHHHID